MWEKEGIFCSKELYGKIDSDYDFSLYSILINSQKPFDLDIPPILDTKNNNVHYLCPICHHFPFITFQNREEICYTCSCRKEKITIEKLFDLKNKYMTLVNNNGNIHGLKSTHKATCHKFKYFIAINVISIYAKNL